MSELEIVFKSEKEMPPMAMSLGTTLYNKTGSWRNIRPVYVEKLAPCRQACPCGEDIPRYLWLAERGRFKEAAQLIRERNPFPSITGRVCPHPCEESCNRGEYDHAVKILALERAVSDYGEEEGKDLPGIEEREERVAVIGSGPAGLACSYYLRRMGYKVSVFEALDALGGMLRFAIPEYRLPRGILDREIEHLFDMGIELKTNSALGRDLGWEDLSEYEAVFLATGAHVSRSLGVEGEKLDGVISGLSFLRDLNSGKKVVLGDEVVVIGGGNTAIDAARCALRMGRLPKILYRRSREEMPAIEDEVENAEMEGIEIRYLTQPVRVYGENGKVRSLELVNMRLGEPDESGRRRPIPIKGSEFRVDVDTVITAIGESPDLSFLPQDVKADWAVSTDHKGATSKKGTFAGGDCVIGPSTVSEAIAWGRRGAFSIHSWLQGVPEEEEVENQVVKYEDLNLAYFQPREAISVKTLAVEERAKGFEEINTGLSREEAEREAERCFSCGVCDGCRNCWLFCPDVAITQLEERKFEVDYDYCKGCGVCAEECPRHVISIEEERR